MPVKLKLQRRGRKKKPHYNIVVASNKQPRDGRPIEKLGFYNPNTTPATIKLDNEKAVQWLQEGAQPTPTVDRILSFSGAKYRKHLLRGVRKGVISQEEADEKYGKWLDDKAQQIQQRIDKAKEEADQRLKERLEAEAEINRKRAEALQANQAEASEAESSEEAAAEEGSEEAVAEEPSGEAAAEENAETQQAEGSEAAEESAETKDSEEEAGSAEGEEEASKE